jgi:hypothetical protein
LLRRSSHPSTTRRLFKLSARVAVVLTGEFNETGSSTAIVRGDWMTNPAGDPIRKQAKR